MYAKARSWLEDQKEKAQETALLLQDYPEAKEELEAPAVIEWIEQQLEQTHSEWMRQATTGDALMAICDATADLIDGSEAEI